MQQTLVVTENYVGNTPCGMGIQKYEALCCRELTTPLNHKFMKKILNRIIKLTTLLNQGFQQNDSHTSSLSADLIKRENYACSLVQYRLSERH